MQEIHQPVLDLILIYFSDYSFTHLPFILLMASLPDCQCVFKGRW